MPNVVIIADRQVESVCQDAVTFANSCQSDFNFYLIPNINFEDSSFNKTSLEVEEALKHLENIKKKYGYQNDDLVLCFYNGTLIDTDHGLSNLFCSGSRYDEDYPCTGVISLKYLGWNVLEEKYNYEVQKHSILHLIICGIIGSYTHLVAHNDVGCLLDLNLRLTSFNLKLQKGYYLCSKFEYSCFDNLRQEKYGNSIIRLCEKFKTGNYQQTIVKEIIMGDKIQVGDINNNSGQIVIGKNITIGTSQEEKNNLTEKINELINLIRLENIPEEDKQTLITNFDKVKEEILEEEEPDKSRIAKWLTKTKNTAEKLVLTHETSQAIVWIYNGLNFIIGSIG